MVLKHLRVSQVSSQCATMSGRKCKGMTMGYNLVELLQITFNYSILDRDFRGQMLGLFEGVMQDFKDACRQEK